MWGMGGGGLLFHFILSKIGAHIMDELIERFIQCVRTCENTA